MVEIEPLLLSACVIIDGIAFEVVNDMETKKLFATDLLDLSNKASFVIRGQELVLSVSSFCEKSREQALLEAISINYMLLIDEVKNA